MRNWLTMRPEEFDVDVEPALFDVDPAPLGAVKPEDGCGTGDLLAELSADES